MEAKTESYYMTPRIITDEEELISVGWVHETQRITKEQAEALLKGKKIGWTDGECTHLIQLKEGE